MAMIDACPKNLDEIRNASAKLECGLDRFGNSQYVCLPNTEKSSLIEFCYKGLMGLKEKGKITHRNVTVLLYCSMLIINTLILVGTVGRPKYLEIYI